MAINYIFVLETQRHVGIDVSLSNLINTILNYKVSNISYSYTYTLNILDMQEVKLEFPAKVTTEIAVYIYRTCSKPEYGGTESKNGV